MRIPYPNKRHIHSRRFDITAARNLSIVSAQETVSEKAASSKVSGFVGSFWQPAIGSVSVPLLSAAQGIKSMADAAKDSGDSRMQALAERLLRDS